MSDEAVQWLITNIGEIGVSGILLLVLIAIVRGWIVLKPYHERMMANGDKAIETLEILNPKLQSFEVLAAVQKVRDEYGQKEQEELKIRNAELMERLTECRTNLARCQETMGDTGT